MPTLKNAVQHNINILKRINAFLLQWGENLSEEQLFWVCCQLEKVKDIGFTLSPNQWQGIVGNDNYLLYLLVYWRDNTKMLMFYYRDSEGNNRHYLPLTDNMITEIHDFIIAYQEN